LFSVRQPSASIGDFTGWEEAPDSGAAGGEGSLLRLVPLELQSARRAALHLCHDLFDCRGVGHDPRLALRVEYSG
jgi:hypothetical protein